MRKFCWSPHEIPLYKPTSIYDLLIQNILLLFSWSVFGKPLVEFWIGRFQVNDDGSGQPKAPTKSQEEFFIFMNFLVYSIFVCFTKARARNLNDIATTEKCQCNKKNPRLGGGNSNIFPHFHFHPDPWGNDPIWLPHIFSNGLVKNHQLEDMFPSLGSPKNS